MLTDSERPGLVGGCISGVGGDCDSLNSTPAHVPRNITTEDAFVASQVRPLSLRRYKHLSTASVLISVFTIEDGIANVRQLSPNDPSVCIVVSDLKVVVRDRWYMGVVIKGCQGDFMINTSATSSMVSHEFY